MIRAHDLLEASDSRKPRASGDDPSGQVFVGRRRSVNPARAGMIRPVRAAKGESARKPRASGDDPKSRLVTAAQSR